jgi:hypothetical protein
MQDRLKDFSGLQFQMNASYLDYNMLNGRNLQLSAELNENVIDVNANIKQLAEEATFAFQTKGILDDEQLTFIIQNFNLRSDTYQWKNQGVPSIQYHAGHKLTLENFLFESDSQFVQVNGTFSSDVKDSVRYDIGNFDRSKVSQILDGRIDFDGVLNGAFTTTTLTTIPTIQGDIELEELYLNNNLFGDIDRITPGFSIICAFYGFQVVDILLVFKVHIVEKHPDCTVFPVQYHGWIGSGLSKRIVDYCFDIRPCRSIVGTSPDDDIDIPVAAEISTVLYTFIYCRYQVAVWSCDEGRNPVAAGLKIPAVEKILKFESRISFYILG